MVVTSNRSPSPMSTRPSLNSRNPEVSNPIRKSFSGNPFAKPSVYANPRSLNPITPANSPSDLGSRNSLDKENEKDNHLKVKGRSSAISKSTKNFMSPTISAASKITSPSPRKKVLGDRNEPVRTSVSFSTDGRSSCSSLNLSDLAEDTDPKSEMGLNQKVEALSVDSAHKVTPFPKASKSDEVLISKVPSISHDSLNSTITSESGCVNGDENSKISPGLSCSSGPVLAPLDMDPSLPPYDPKTNYLSPRPQFLHYKPNPRIEVYLHKEIGFDSAKGKCLEESFLAESFSETETTEETQSEDSQKESTEETQSEDSQKESEDSSLVEIQKESGDASSVEMIGEDEEKKEPHVSEPNLTFSSQLSKETVEEKGVPMPHVEEMIKTYEEMKEPHVSEPNPTFSSQLSKETIEEKGVPMPHTETIQVDASKPTLINTQLTEESKKTVEARRRVLKPYFRPKSLPFLLFLTIACLTFYVTDSPVISRHSVFKDQSFNYKPYSVFAKPNFNGLAQNFMFWSANSFSYLSNLFPVPRDVRKLHSLHFANLTKENPLVDGCLMFGKGDKESFEQNEGERMVEIEAENKIKEERVVEIESMEEKGRPKSDAHDRIEDTLKEVIEIESLEGRGHPESEAEETIEDALEADNRIEDAFEGVVEIESLEENGRAEIVVDDRIEGAPEEYKISGFEEESHGDIEIGGNILDALEEHRNPVSEVAEVYPENSIVFKDQLAVIPQASNIPSENDFNSCAEDELIRSDVSPKNSEVNVLHEISQNFGGSLVNGSKVKFLDMLGISLLVLTLITAAVYITKREKTSNQNAAIPVNQLPAKKLISNSVTATTEHRYQEIMSSQIWPTEVDMVGESCPSEMSSFQSYSYGKQGTNEVQSSEKKQRKTLKRESLASSSEYSVDSLSYGSFTTYELIQRKHGGEEETVTPVRRSSRIRKVTSP